MTRFRLLEEHMPLLPSLGSGTELDFSVDDFIEREIDRLSGGGLQSIDVYQIEQNIADLSLSLERIAAYRRELHGVIAERIRSGMAYASSYALSQADADVEIAKAAGSRPIIDAIARKLAITRQSIAELEKRHAVDGSPLNYQQVIDRTLFRLRYELYDCWSRSWAVRKGLLELYGDTGLKFPLLGSFVYATFSGARFIDEWLAWLSEVSRFVERSQMFETTSEFCLSLGTVNQYTAADPRNPDEFRPIVPDLLAKIRSGDFIQFNLHRNRRNVRDDFPGFLTDTAGLRSVALSVAAPEGHARDWRYEAIVMVPGASGWQGISNIGPVGAELTWSSEPAIYNRPLFGDWRISMRRSPTMNEAWDYQDRRSPAAWPLLDLFLHVRVVAIGA